MIKPWSTRPCRRAGDAGRVPELWDAQGRSGVQVRPASQRQADGAAPNGAALALAAAFVVRLLRPGAEGTAERRPPGIPAPPRTGGNALLARRVPVYETREMGVVE
jgi:hypothetical protein